MASAQALGALGQFERQHLGGGAARGLAVDAGGGRVGREAEAFEFADKMLFDEDASVGFDIGVEHVLVAHALHENAGAAVHEALREPLVKRVGELVFDFARAAPAM